MGVAERSAFACLVLTDERLDVLTTHRLVGMVMPTPLMLDTVCIDILTPLDAPASLDVAVMLPVQRDETAEHEDLGEIRADPREERVALARGRVVFRVLHRQQQRATDGTPPHREHDDEDRHRAQEYEGDFPRHAGRVSRDTWAGVDDLGARGSPWSGCVALRALAAPVRAQLLDTLEELAAAAESLPDGAR
jgi:hypothetical protein